MNKNMNAKQSETENELCVKDYMLYVYYNQNVNQHWGNILNTCSRKSRLVAFTIEGIQ